MSQPSDTPETNAMFHAWNMRTSSIGVEEPSDFARRMEKERDAAREDARRLAEAISNMGAAIRSLQDGELDQWDAHEAISNIETEALAAHEALTAKV